MPGRDIGPVKRAEVESSAKCKVNCMGKERNFMASTVENRK